MTKLSLAFGAALCIALGCSGSSNSLGPAPTGGSGGAAGDSGGTAAQSSGGSAGKPPAGISLEQAPEAYAKAYCTLIERCGGFFYDLLTAYEDCVMLTAARFRQGGLFALTDAVDDGRVEYHPELMPACLDAVETRACSSLTMREIPACEAAVTCTASEGEPCELNDECEGSLICETSAACPGECVERYSAGVACSADDDCADGLVCSSLTAHCVKPVELGQPCEGGVEAQCAGGSFCAGSDVSKMQTGTCAPLSAVKLGPAGAACDPSAGVLCENGLSCVLTGYEDALVWECRVPSAAGATCGVGLPENCPKGQYCPVDLAGGTFTGTCVPLPASGEACAARPLPGIMPVCAPYVRCGTDNKCIGLRDLGESCSSDALCYSGHCQGGACEPAHTCQ